MLKLTLATFAIFFAAFTATATSIEFTPKIHVEDCPTGAMYPLLQCIDHETALPRQHLEFLDAGDGFYVADYQGESAAGAAKAYGYFSFMLYPHKDGHVFLMLQINAGFSAEPNRNPSAFFEAPQKQFPPWCLVTGERIAVGAREALVELEYTDLVLVP